MYVCFLQKYKEFERAVRVEEIDGLRLVKKLAENMEEMFHKKSEAMKVSQSSQLSSLLSQSSQLSSLLSQSSQFCTTGTEEIEQLLENTN